VLAMRVSFSVFASLAAVGCGFTALALTPTQPQAGNVSDRNDANSEYYQALGKIEKLDADGHRASLVSSAFFQSLGWIGRTACVNYVCSALSVEQCRVVLAYALADEALVVRDHALRIFISSQKFSEFEKVNAANKSINDPRNFRKGRPFWIVERAKGFLSAQKGTSLRD
jgi:hypothetical protein